MTKWLLHLALIAVGLCALTTAAQTFEKTAPQTITLCEVLKTPQAFDGKTLLIRGRINLEFEDFSIYDIDCNTSPQIWLAFGGDVSTPTMSTINDTHRPSGRNLEFQGSEYTLVKDDNFNEFYKLVTAKEKYRPAYRVTATLTGTFFRGKTVTYPSGQHIMSGYGHLGCCHLFIIQQVSDVASKPMSKNDVNEMWRTLKKQHSD
jgi:hypothetical protein